MRLKYLSCCLLSLSIVGCSQHVIKSNSNTSTSTNTSLEQQAVTGVNAMYEYPSYDYRGNMGFQFDTSKGKVANTQTTSNSTQNLDPAIQKQLDQYLKQQKLSLSKQEKQALYEAILAEQSPYSYGQGSDSSSARIAAGLMNFMNDLKISYDGSVHYRDKMASLNLVAKYQKPTLLVEAKLPMVVDFQDYKFYANYFAFMPYLVNKDSQASYRYLDFSNY